MSQEFLIDLPIGAVLDGDGNPVPLVSGEQWISSYSWVLALSKRSSPELGFAELLDASLRLGRGFLASLRGDSVRLGLWAAAVGDATFEGSLRDARKFRAVRESGHVERGRGGIRVQSKRRKLAAACGRSLVNGGITLPFPGKSLIGMLRSVVGDCEAAKQQADFMGALTPRRDPETLEAVLPTRGTVDDRATYDVPLAALIACVPGVYEPQLYDPKLWPPVDERDLVLVGDDLGAREFFHVMRRAVMGQFAAQKTLEAFVAKAGAVPTTETLRDYARAKGLLRVNNDVMLTFRRWLMGFLPAMLGKAVLHRAPGPQTGQRPAHLSVPDSTEHPDAERYIAAWRAIDEACAKFHAVVSVQPWYPRITCPVTAALLERSIAERLDPVPETVKARRKSRPEDGSSDEVKVPYAFRQVPHRVMLRRMRKPGLFNTMTPEEQYAWRVAQAAKARAARAENFKARQEQAALLERRNP